MKNYLITESQLNYVLTENTDNLKKGIAFKITHKNSLEPVYESKLMSFKSEAEFESFKKRLPEEREIIGVIDIE